jgi:hypothetical protein
MIHTEEHTVQQYIEAYQHTQQWPVINTMEGTVALMSE